MFLRLLGAACFAAILSSSVLAQQVIDQTARQAMDETAKSFQTAYNAGNAAGIAALFTKDGVYLTPAGTALSDPQSIAAAINGRIKAGWTKETVSPSGAHAAGNMVWGYGDYSIVGTGPNEGKQIGGKYSMVLSREGDKWLINMLIGNLKPTQDVTGMGSVVKTQ